MASTLHKVSAELGLTALRQASINVHLILLTRFLRMFAYGASTLVLAIFFERLGFSDSRIGLFMSLTLVGDVLVSLGLTFVADNLGRRRILTLGSLLMVASGGVFTVASNYWVLLLAAVVGVISPSGNEIGPFRAVEESTLAHLLDPEDRSDVFAWYVVFGTLGTAGGALTAGWTTRGVQDGGWSDLDSFRLVFGVYAIIGLAKALITLCLNIECELTPATTTQAAEGFSTRETQPLLPDGRQQSATQPAEPTPKARPSMFSQLSRDSRKTLAKLCGLFFFDSLASGMMPYSLIVLYIERKFRVGEGGLGSVLSAAQLLSSIGNMFASSLAKRIGFIRAMVFTHLPAGLLLGLLPAPSSFVLTVVILTARALLASMDQAPRSAFLSAVVKPNERTATMGLVNVVKTASQSSGPLVTGLLAGSEHFWIAFLIAGALKVMYDIGLLAAWSSVRLEGDKSASITAERANAENEEQQPSEGERR